MILQRFCVNRTDYDSTSIEQQRLTRASGRSVGGIGCHQQIWTERLRLRHSGHSAVLCVVRRWMVNLTGSMSAKDCRYDNVCAESIFHSLEMDCILGEYFADREAMGSEIFNYIGCDYNKWRRHSACGGIGPEQFENQYLT